MLEYSKLNVKLTDTQLRNKAGKTLRMISKMLDRSDLPHKLLWTTRQNTKLRYAFESIISTDIRLSKAQIRKIIKLGGILGALLS